MGRVGKANAVHGHARKGATTGAFRSWSAMHQRCSPASEGRLDWHRYGGRGVIVCARWSEPDGRGFANFLADMGERPEGMTLDRIDPDGNYEPGNCRWATPAEQARNRSKADRAPNRVAPMRQDR